MPEEETFHIFKYVLAGLHASDELSNYLPKDCQPPQFLDQSKVNQEKKDQWVEQYKKIRQAFGLIGFRDDDLEAFNQIILAIYVACHIGFSPRTTENERGKVTLK